MRLSNLAQMLILFPFLSHSDWHFHAIVKKNLPHRIDYNSTFSYDFPLYMYLQKLDFLKFNSFRLVEKNVH